MTNVTSTQTSSSRTSTSSLATRVQAHDELLKFVIFGIVVAIVTLGLDLYQDRKIYELNISLQQDISASDKVLTDSQLGLREKDFELAQEIKMFKQCLLLGGWETCLSE